MSLSPRSMREATDAVRRLLEQRHLEVYENLVAVKGERHAKAVIALSDIFGKLICLADFLPEHPAFMVVVKQTMAAVEGLVDLAGLDLAAVLADAEPLIEMRVTQRRALG